MGAWVETFSIGYFGLWGNGGFIDASDTAVIFGCGPVGISATMVAKTAGAKVIVVDPISSRRALALKYGADYVVDPTAGNLKAQIDKITDGKGATVIAEASGNDNAIASTFEIAGHSCRIHLIGHSIGRKVPVELGWTIWKTLKINGSGGTKDFGQRTIRFMSAIKDKYDFEALNTHHFAFDQIHEAFKTAIHEKDNAFKVMLKFDV
jgi:threonine dehydrogenase-like Zn-dependent dehydrogenase